jgi:hypothetical protein
MSKGKSLKYETVDSNLIKAFPELKKPHKKLMDDWDHEERPQYIIFESMFRAFIEIILNIEKASEEKEKLIKRSFDFVEEMFLFGEDAVKDLAWIAMFEGKPPWYFALSRDYWSPQTFFVVSKNEDRLEKFLLSKNKTGLDHEFIDLYGVREVILAKLKNDKINRIDIPGISYPAISTPLESLEAAKKHKDGVFFLACFGTSRPYVVGPADQVFCQEKDMKRLLLDLVQYDREEPQQEKKIEIAYFRIPHAERIWNMSKGKERHGRYLGKLWIKEKFIQKGFEKKINDVIAGKAS